MNKIIILTIAYLLSACVLTPEQKAERAAAQKRYEQNLQISLAEQCDKETARLMREQLEQYPYDNEQKKQDFKLRYIEKINDPMFQSCYKMAWQNHISQQHLREIRNRYYYDEWGFYRSPFFAPWWW